jgi:hypothetical protein
MLEARSRTESGVACERDAAGGMRISFIHSHDLLGQVDGCGSARPR